MSTVCPVTDLLLQAYLERVLPSFLFEEIKGHLDQCPICWDCWHRFRWERAKRTRGFVEFQAFLEEQGEPLQDALDSSKALLRAWQRAQPQTPAERDAFFRHDPYYLYNLTIWHESGNRPPYVTGALPILRQLEAGTICDFGCGIGTDGIRFMEQGFRVVFCEFDNASSRFLRWRLQRRHMSAHWCEPTELGQLQPCETLWAIDVLDHLPDLHRIIPLLEQCRIVCIENDSQHKAHGGASFHVHHPSHRLHELLVSYHFKNVSTTHLLMIWQKEAVQTL